MENEIYKILTQTEWDEFQKNGIFPGTPVDLNDGYIHLSQKKQVAGVITRFYAKVSPLYIIGFSLKSFGNNIKWEKASNQEEYPHLYSIPLKLSDVLNTEVIKQHQVISY